METRISDKDLDRTLADVLARVKAQGETFVVERNGVAIARISPAVPAGTPVKEFAKRLRGMPTPGREIMDTVDEFQNNQPKVVLPEWLDS